MYTVSIIIFIIAILWVGWAYHRATNKPILNPLPPKYARRVADGAVDLNTYPTYTLASTMADSYNMLYLPGNASLGAYSAGIACALQQKQDFHTIVGISSGALATLFLYANDTDTLETFLTEIDTPKVISQKPKVFSLLFGYSFADNQLLQVYLQKFITDTFIDILQSRYIQGFRGYVISNNLDTGQSVFWDLGAIAHMNMSYDERRKKIISAVVASTALPMIFNPIAVPVTVQGVTYTQPHVDGAVSAHTVFYNYMLPQNIEDFTHKHITIAQSNSFYSISCVQPIIWKTVGIGATALARCYQGAYEASIKTTSVFARTHKMYTKINHIGTDTILTSNPMDFSNKNITTYFYTGLNDAMENKIQWDSF